MKNNSIKRKMYLLNFNCPIEEIATYLSTLNPLEQKVMEMYLGINYPKDLSLKEIADKLNKQQEEITYVFLLTNEKLNKIIPPLTNQGKASYEVDLFFNQIEDGVVYQNDLDELKTTLQELLTYQGSKKLIEDVTTKLKKLNIKICDRYDKKREYELITLYNKTADKKYLNELLNMHNNFILSLANQYYKKDYGHGFSREDFYQEAVNGFILAVSKFDISQNKRLLTYAAYWIRNLINKNIYRTSSQFNITHDFYNKLIKYNHLIDYYHDKYSKNPSLEEVVQELDITPQMALELINFNYYKSDVYYLDAPVSDSLGSLRDKENLTLANIIKDENVDIEKETIQGITSKDIKKVLKEVLTPRELKIILLRNGFVNNRVYTLEEIGKMEKVTRKRINQIEHKALTKLRDSLKFNAFKNNYDEPPKVRIITIMEYVNAPLAYIKCCLNFVSPKVKQNVYDLWGPDLDEKIEYKKHYSGITTFLEIIKTYQKLYIETNSLRTVENAFKYPQLFAMYTNGDLQNIYCLYHDFLRDNVDINLGLHPEFNKFLKINLDKTLDLNKIFQSSTFLTHYFEFAKILENSKNRVVSRILKK